MTGDPSCWLFRAGDPLFRRTAKPSACGPVAKLSNNANRGLQNLDHQPVVSALHHLGVFELDPLNQFLEALHAPGLMAAKVDSSETPETLNVVLRNTGHQFLEVAMIPRNDDGPQFITGRCNHWIRGSARKQVSDQTNVVRALSKKLGNRVRHVFIDEQQHPEWHRGALAHALLLTRTLKLDGSVNVFWCQAGVLSNDCAIGESGLMEIPDCGSRNPRARYYMRVMNDVAMTLKLADLLWPSIAEPQGS